MADLNKVFLMGRLTFDPELKRTASGTAVTELRMAINRFWTGSDGEQQKDTLFIDVTVWTRQAENCCERLRKGSLVHVEGYLKTDEWTTQAGERRTKIRVQAERVQFLDPRSGSDSGGGTSGDDYAPMREPQPRRAAPPSEARGAGNGPGRGYPPPPSAGAPPRRPAVAAEPEEDDDIPF